MTLSAEQRRAVERWGQDVCVVAGPGSGKTRVLTERFAWLVEQRHVDPGRILAITFTEKAAVEIKRRLVQRFAGDAVRREAVERAWVTTIDGFCARLLQEHAIEAGLAPDFLVLEQAAADRLKREAAETALDELFAERPVEMRRLLEAVELATSDGGRQEDLAAALLRIHDAMRVAGVKKMPAAPANADWLPEAREEARRLLATPCAEWAREFLALPETLSVRHFEVLAQFHPSIQKVKAAKRLRDEIKPLLESQWAETWYRDLRELLALAIERIGDAYLRRKRSEAAVDFADLEQFAVDLLETHAGVRQAVSGRFDEILMDELQDTNPLQWRLVNLVKRRLFAVGDVNQSIYGFRHAEPEVFRDYRAAVEQQGEVDEFHDNHRNHPEILGAVEKMLGGRPGIEWRPLRACGIFRPARGPRVERLMGVGDEPDRNEAEQVAARIAAWRAAGELAYKDVAILVRTNAAMEPFAEALEAAGIPFLVAGGRGFLEARETRDVLLLLAAFVNAQDEYALTGVLRSPLVGLRDEDLLRLGREGWRAEWERRFGAARRMVGFLPPDLVVARALDECGYWAQLRERERANVEKLLAWLRRAYRHRPRGLAELLEDLEALREVRSEADAPPPEAGDVVQIMTMHAAKGLEFPVVFVSALHKRPQAHLPALLFGAGRGLGVKWRNPATGETVADPTYSALKQEAKAREADEADRLLYVAMTRAGRRLILTHAHRKTKTEWEKLVMDMLPQPASAPDAPVAAPLAEAATGEERLLARPELHGQYDAAVAVTSVALFAACPQRYYLARYLGLEPAPEGEGTGAIALGLAVHRALAGEAVDSPEALELKARFEASAWGRRAARAVRAEREFQFLAEVEGLILHGQIDLWFEEGGELVVVDYKTDREHSAAETYAVQLRLYALGLERYAGRRPDRAVLYYPRSDRSLEVDLTVDARPLVARLREAQQTQRFPVQPGAQCSKCPFFAKLCPEGRQQINSGPLFGPPSSFLRPQSAGS
jgi:ATP-dependent exoDNAse (exonuclease V) beta subunit